MLLIGVLVWSLDAGITFAFFSDKSFTEVFLSDLTAQQIYARGILVAVCCLTYLVITRDRILKDRYSILQHAYNHVIPICITNTHYDIISANDSYWNIFGRPTDLSKPVKCYENRPGETCRTERCPLVRVVGGDREYVCEPRKEFGGKLRYFIVTARPLLDAHSNIIGVVECFQDITMRKQLEQEKEKLIGELQESLDQVNLLSGFIPICASCKKIRDDKGFWNQIEAYIRDHSEAEFTHSICPDCMEKIYPYGTDT